MASVNGTSGNDSIATGADDDTIDAGAGADSVYAGAGNDSIEGGDGYDQLHGGDGNDTISGGAGDNSYDDIYGGAGDDWIVTSDGDDNWVYGGDGDDTVYGGVLADEIYGGNDDDALSGNAGDDTIYGGSGKDSLYGGAGSDRIFAGDDDDLIQGEEGDDTLFGGAGNDTFNFMDTAGTDTVNGDAGQDEMTFFASTDATITYIANAEGTYTQNGGATSGSFQNIQGINTSGGHDTIDGSADAAGLTLSSGAGDDTVTGGSGNDTLYGGSGDDTLTGGAGDDALFGGTGDDTFVMGDGDDVVYDFDIAATAGDDQDQLDVSGLQNPDGSPVKVGNVTVVDDGSGNAKLLFPEGESVVLDGVSPGQMSSPAQLFAAGIPCFTPGAMIATNMGERAVETLNVGDLVFTRDHGLQPIRWIGQRTVAAQGDFAPIRINPGVVVGQTAPLLVSPQHRFLFQGYRAELLFGESEVFVTAKHLVDGQSVAIEPTHQVTYLHMLFDHHEVVFANSAATESFHPGEQAIGAVDSAAREELFSLFPHLRADLTQYGATARRSLKKHEAMMVRQ